MQRIPTKKPTVQKPCIDRADPEVKAQLRLALLT